MAHIVAILVLIVTVTVAVSCSRRGQSGAGQSAGNVTESREGSESGGEGSGEHGSGGEGSEGGAAGSEEGGNAPRPRPDLRHGPRRRSSHHELRCGQQRLCRHRRKHHRRHPDTGTHRSPPLKRHRARPHNADRSGAGEILDIVLPRQRSPSTAGTPHAEVGASEGGGEAAANTAVAAKAVVKAAVSPAVSPAVRAAARVETPPARSWPSTKAGTGASSTASEPPCPMTPLRRYSQGSSRIRPTRRSASCRSS